MDKCKRDLCLREEDALADLILSEKSLLRGYLAAMEKCPSEGTRSLLEKLFSFAVQDLHALQEESARRRRKEVQDEKDVLRALREKKKELLRISSAE